MKLSKEDLQELAECVRQAILNEFAMQHLSGNLMNTIKVETDDEDKVQVIIPAETYNMYQYFMHGTIIPNGRGSYASKLNDEGSAFMVYWGTSANPHRKLVEPRNHIGYIDKVINDAVNDWLMKKKDKYKLKTRMDV